MHSTPLPHAPFPAWIAKEKSKQLWLGRMYIHMLASSFILPLDLYEASRQERGIVAIQAEHDEKRI